ncbi:Chemotaxis protein [Desulfonema limicola]|uniref:Chemotaxis protein n=1 Tax=Desulfonema limicola TaxID=45656 RepID=A0A975BA82_9BACT|nr:chemotaxis protein CheW [Desulfonema limicola]QTA81592.1 Chemotaxis protein [Desulfonema limicola]
MNKTGITETGQYLTFKLADEIFAINVIQVREVLDLSTITKVPGTPDFMRGVINVRGSVVPVMDLRLKFGLTKTENTLDTRIVVMELSLEGEITVLGTLADSVNEVIDLESSQIEPPPKIGLRWKTEFIKGIGKRNDMFIIILDIDRVFSSDEIALVEETSTEVLKDKHKEKDQAEEKPETSEQSEKSEQIDDEASSSQDLHEKDELEETGLSEKIRL